MGKCLAIDSEKALAELLQTGDEPAVLEWLEGEEAERVEFTCRCLALAVTKGMAQAARRMGELGFHLAVTDDAAAKKAIEQAQSMRGLLDFLSDYRYCKAQRSYYLPVAESVESCEPVAALAAIGALSAHDKSELLSLCLRMDNPALARVLLQNGASLVDDIRQDIPQELREANNISMANTGRHWAEMVTPQRSLETLELIFEQIGEERVRIYKGWWGSYQRQEGFAAKLAAIACHSDAARCEDVGRLLETLAKAGELQGLKAACSWEGIEPAQLDAALACAQEAGNIEASAVIMGARHAQSATLELLDF